MNNDDTMLPVGEPFPDQTIRSDGWVYRDLPKLSLEDFDKFVGIVGEKNIKWLSLAHYGDAKRGQLFISPDGVEALRAYAAAKGSVQ